ncbi:ATP-binding protein [Nocardiopsis ansamitocini]|uniref:Histidine kinase/HSP90-like ATPase domain-containing protein n=1 Tax=Nocardiopsis ansamitocini TaxID=1670832 RepID=A0A9W6P9U0_9ACTN|nr:ATP-binding protein [Nocardiopsis ansamitocini]GLU50290.1 hypothetical protein Nans01_46410 [Nocardiopsis ansamitocini]
MAVCTAVFPGVPGSVAEVRRFVAAALATAPEAVVPPEVSQTAELLVSELATNAITHTHSGDPGASYGVEVRVDAGRVRVEVKNRHPHDVLNRPRVRTPEADAEHGRGLFLVAVLATEWGTTAHRPGVFFTLEWVVGVPETEASILTRARPCGEREGHSVDRARPTAARHRKETPPRLLCLLVLAGVLVVAAVMPARRVGRHCTGAPGAAPHVPGPQPVPVRQARVVPRIPDYPRFAEVAESHSALWEVTYRYGEAAPYAARNRVTAHVVAVSDIELLDHCLHVYEPPSPLRAYTAPRVRAHDLGAEQRALDDHAGSSDRPGR